jgi:hypothetical protein
MFDFFLEGVIPPRKILHEGRSSQDGDTQADHQNSTRHDKVGNPFAEMPACI